MPVLMFLLLIVGNMLNMQYNMQQYAKYANTISICRICTPHFADVARLSPAADRQGPACPAAERRPGRSDSDPARQPKNCPGFQYIGCRMIIEQLRTWNLNIGIKK